MKFSPNFLQNPKALADLRKCGSILADVRETVVAAVKPGVKFEDLEAIAQQTLAKHHALPSFTTVEDYKWATCIVKNEGCCHGIPRGKTVDLGDLISVDVGALYNRIHTDTTATVSVGTPTKAQARFLQAGQEALTAAIQQAVPGNSVYDISFAIQTVIQSYGFSPVYQLTGHSIGYELHMLPNIPCVAKASSKNQVLVAGMAIAIEPMYAEGDSTLELAADGWTYQTVDRSLTGMFEHTVLVTPQGPEVITASLADSLLRNP